MLIFSERHLRTVLAEYATHCTYGQDPPVHANATAPVGDAVEDAVLRDAENEHDSIVRREYRKRKTSDAEMQVSCSHRRCNAYSDAMILTVSVRAGADGPARDRALHAPAFPVSAGSGYDHARTIIVDHPLGAAVSSPPPVMMSTDRSGHTAGEHAVGGSEGLHSCGQLTGGRGSRAILREGDRAERGDDHTRLAGQRARTRAARRCPASATSTATAGDHASDVGRHAVCTCLTADRTHNCDDVWKPIGAAERIDRSPLPLLGSSPTVDSPTGCTVWTTT